MSHTETTEAVERLVDEFDLKFSTLVSENPDGTTTRKGVNYEMLDWLRTALTTIRKETLEAERERLIVHIQRKGYDRMFAEQFLGVDSKMEVTSTKEIV